jgi:hypothetical protein
VTNRRYSLRRLKERAPSQRAVWGRIVFYVLLLAVILLLQDRIGSGAAGCLGAFGP